MRILFLSSVYPQPGDPSRGTYCRNLLRALAAEHQVRVVAPWPWHRRLQHVLCGGGAYEEVLGVVRPTSYHMPRLLTRYHGRMMRASIASAVKGYIAGGFRPDCILTYWAYPDGEAALMTARSLGVPVALIAGGSDVLLIDAHPDRARLLDVLRGSDAILAVSRDLANRAVGLGVDPRRVHVVYQGVDTSLFRPGNAEEARSRLGLPRDCTLLLWVGRMVPVKGLDTLLEAYAVLGRRGVGARLLLVGDGPSRRGLAAQVEAMGLSGVVTFVGPKRPEELPDWYLASDLVVLSSLSEGVPNVLREARACGRRFVATEVGGVAEIADASCRLVASGSAAALADGIEASLGDCEARASQAGIITWADSAAQTVEILSRLVPPRGRVSNPDQETHDGRISTPI